MAAALEQTPIEVTQFELPADYAKRWTEGAGMFWMQKCETDRGLERWNGAVKRGGEWLYAQIDVEPVTKYAYICGHDRIRAAKTFVATYGGMTFVGGEVVDLKKLPDPAAAPVPKKKPSEAFAIICGSDRTSSRVVEITDAPAASMPKAEPPTEAPKKVEPSPVVQEKPAESPAKPKPESKPCIICHQPSYPDGSRLGGLMLYWCENCKTEWA